MDWNVYFLSIAGAVAAKSKDPSTKVGCVITGPGREIRSTGYNGLPRRVDDRPERMERPAKYVWTSHAEENAVAQAARQGTSLAGTIAYVTHPPCARCTRMLLQAGVEAIVAGPGRVVLANADEAEASRIMCEEAGVPVVHYGARP